MHDILDKFHIEDINNAIHPSMFVADERYSLFILRLPDEYEDDLYIKSYPYVIANDNYFLFDREKNEFRELGNLQSFYLSLDKKVDLAMEVTADIFSALDEMEENFYTNKKIQNFTQDWFYYKNTLIRLSRVLSKAIVELEKFIRHYKSSTDFLKIHFDDLLEHLERTNRTALHAVEKIDALYNFFTSIQNDKMNKTIYLLTLLSALFLPLNLVVGFFGMNTTGLPFSDGHSGTFYVVGLLGFIVVCISFIAILSRFLQKK